MTVLHMRQSSPPLPTARLCENGSFVIVIDGIYYAAALVGAGFLVRWLAGPWFAAPLWLLAAFCLYFFRDPERCIPAGAVAVGSDEAPAKGDPSASLVIHIKR